MTRKCMTTGIRCSDGSRNSGDRNFEEAVAAIESVICAREFFCYCFLESHKALFPCFAKIPFSARDGRI